MLIVDKDNILIDSFDLNIDQTQLQRQYGDPFNQNDYIGLDLSHFNRIIPCNSNLYGLIRDVLYEINYNNIKAIAKIPDNNSQGFAKMCLFNNNILVTNEKSFYKLVDNKFEQIQLYYNDIVIRPRDVHLYDFNGHATMKINWDGKWFLFQILEPSCKLLFSGDRLSAQISNSGFQVFNVEGSNSKLVLDYTHDQIQLSHNFEQCSSSYYSMVQSSYICEYSTEIMRKLIPDYDTFIIRRQNIIESIQANLPKKKEFESIISQLYPQITPADFVFQNSYQLKDHLIFYRNKYAYITNKNLKVLNRIKINFIVKQSNIDFTSDSYDSYHKLWYCNNCVYALLKDTLFSVDLFKFKEIQKIPGQYGLGFVRICVFKNQILTTNEKQFFVLDQKTNKFKEKIFYKDGVQIQSRDVGLYSFGDNAVARIFENDAQYIISLNDNGCQVLHSGKNIDDLVPAQGIWPNYIGQNAYCIIDLTTNPVQASYCILENSDFYKASYKTRSQSDQQFIYSNDHIDYQEMFMKTFVDQDYYLRRDSIYNNLKSKIIYKQIDVIDKFGRINYVLSQNQHNQLFEDIFQLKNKDLLRLTQTQNTVFKLLQKEDMKAQRNYFSGFFRNHLDLLRDQFEFRMNQQQQDLRQQQIEQQQQIEMPTSDSDEEMS
ncbi:Conserved_hypothetical protein [Hexamita inflata]|uniref:Uncharacterized protein n=1 Tax=Hexamita inflata TaxID=28002 RepID=A0AA86Q3Z3_9EUKA|nr:Conserved hypothetical protein [Hexamita inflata]